MLAKLFLVFLVGYASASAPHYAWKPNTEYTYRVLGRTLSGIPDHDPTMSGILLKAELRIVPKTPEILTAKLLQPQYSQIQMKFHDSWEEEVPESKCHYQPLAISQEPFEIHLQDGIVKDIVVAKTLKNWEANMIKSIVSQIQLNVNAKHPIDSEINMLPRGKETYGVYKVMEKTVTGEFETTYVLKPESEEIFSIHSHDERDQAHENILISKSKNFTNHGVFVGFHYGFGEMETSEPNTDSMGKFMNRTSISDAVISGNLNDYVIQTSNTSNVISFSPLYNHHQSAIVASKVCLILRNIQPGKTYSSPSEPIPVGIIYQYDNSYGSNHVESSRQPQHVPGEAIAYDRPAYQRLNAASGHSKSKGYHLDHSQLELDQPSLALAHFTTGLEGKALKFSDTINVVEESKKIAREIGEDLQHPNDIPKQETIGKFVILVRLCRQMNKEEMHKAAEELYSQEQHGAKLESWKAIRDAIAQTGSGPALLTVQEWIKANKVDELEATSLVARMAVAARFPTAKYLRTFQKLVEESIEKERGCLNDTAVISYADLLYKVCVNQEMSYQEYPFHTYGSFHNAECQNIVKEYIRYLEQRLHKSVAESDSHEILVYSVALGHIGHHDVYRALEKYIRQTPEKRQRLPKEQQVTEFQRFIMVNSLSRFIELHPEAGREILSSIYFSSSEPQELRSLAVYLTARAEPDISLLTAMAQYTHVDNNEYVNSAVKSTIRALIAMDYEPAIDAERYLDDEEYGIQYSHNVLHKYVRHHMETELRQSLRTFSGVDQIIPKGIEGRLEVILGEGHVNLAMYGALVSSVEELLQQLEFQTKHHDEEVHRKQSQLKDNPHSSHKIYETLGMHVEEGEELEGVLRLRIADAFRHMAFDNHTIENIAEVAKRWHQELKAGKKFSLTKWAINHEAVLGAPTEMGIPYSFTSAVVALMSLDGKIQAAAHPEISDGHLLQAPESVQGEAELHNLFSKGFSSTIRFYTPFDHQDYISGYIKQLQINLPVSSKVHVDLKNNDITWNLKAIQPEENIKLFHYSSVPYNAIADLLSLRPPQLAKQYIALTQEHPRVYETEFGKHTIGMAFLFRQETDDLHLGLNRLFHSIRHRGAIETAMQLFFDNEMRYSKTELWYLGKQCVNREIKSQLRYLRKYYEHQQGSAPSVQEILNLPPQQPARLQQVAEKVAADIHSVHVLAGDLQIQFVGPQEYHIHAGAASAVGPVDKRSRVVAYIHTESKQDGSKPWHLALVHNGESPNTNGLDYEYALKMDARVRAHAKLALGHKDHLSTVEVEAEFHKTHERVEYLKELPEHHRCREEIKEGNHILPECANLTARANLLDDISVRIKYDGISHFAKQLLQRAAEHARPCIANHFEFEHEGAQDKREVNLHVRFTPDLTHANYSLEGVLATEMEHHCERIPINRWQRQLFVLHPVFPVTTRLFAEANHVDTYRPICVVDKTRAATFDGEEYRAQLSDSWTVMLHYLPQYAHQAHHSDLKYRQVHQIREHVVLVRNENHGKAVKITLRTPDTEQKLVEVELKPTGQPSPKVKVLVDKQEVQYDQQRSRDFHNHAIRVHGLPNDEVKVYVSDRYYLIADGQRVKLTVTCPHFNNATRGLCGNFNGIERDDFLLPNDRVSVENPQEFVHAYTLGSPHQNKAHRVQHERVYYPIPSYEQVEELSHHRIDNSDTSSCTAHRTLYFRNHHRDCFSIRAYPVCKPGCHPQEEVNKKVDVICVDESGASQQWKRKAEAGDYLNFQQRQPNDHIETKIHNHCQQ